MKETLEREIKLAPEEGFVLPELGGRRMPTRVFTSTYHDTADLRLARHRITFRHRVEDGAGVWQLKLPRGAARLELELGGPPARPPVELLDLLTAYLRGAALAPVARLRTRREVVLARGAEIVDDSVAVLVGQRISQRFREVEVELIDGDEKALGRLAKELRKAGAHESEELQPKLYRVLGLNGAPTRPKLTQDTPPAEALAIALDSEYRALFTHDPGTRRGEDPESLHQLRVAIRRLKWADRIDHVHIKTADLPRFQQVVDEGLPTNAIWEREVFPKLGEGALDVDAFLAALREIDYAGWLVVEQDIFPTTAERFARAAADQRANREFLKERGL